MLTSRIALLLVFICSGLEGWGQLESVPPPDVVAAATSAFHEYDNGSTFDTYLESGPNVPAQIVIPRTYNPTSNVALPSPRPQYPNDHIAGLVERSAFVGSAVVLKRWTYPTDGNTFTVSIYLSRVVDVAIGTSEHLHNGSLIYIARAGGPVTYKNHEIRGVDPGFHLFHLQQEYLIFGSKIGANLFKVDSDRVLEVHEHRLTETNTQERHKDFYTHRDKADVLAEAISAQQVLRDEAARSNDTAQK